MEGEKDAAYPPTTSGSPAANPSSSGEHPPSYYPPDQTSYSPNQTAYPPDQTAYPPNQTAYPPNQTAYPPNHGQTAYPLAEPNKYPPATAHNNYSPPPQMQQQMQSNVVVVSNQPSQPTVITHRSHNSGAGQGAMVFAVIVSVFAFCCCWWALFCSIPAMVFAQNANSASDPQSAKTNRNISLVLSGVTLFTGLVGIAIVFGVVFGVYVPSIQRITTTTSRTCGYNIYGYYSCSG